MKADFSVPKTDNPIRLKDRMLELQNMYGMVAEELTQSRLESDTLESALSYIRDKSFLSLETGTVEEKKARAKVEVEIEISYIVDGKKTKKAITYHMCKYLLLRAKSKVGRMWLYLEELKSAIAVCQMFPTKSF